MTAAEKLITENLDIWSSAIQVKSSAGRGNGKKLELYGIKKLRELILELAVRGLLVQQCSSDEPASELLNRIALQKAKLLNEGTIKKQKAASPIDDMEIPYVIPEDWAWSRLPDVCDYGPGKTPSTKNPAYWEEGGAGYPWVSISDMTHHETLLDTAKSISQKAVESVFKSSPVKAGALLMSFKLTLGKMSKLGVDAYHNEAIIAVYPYQGISQDFIYRFLPNRALAGNSKQAIKGATLNSASLANILLPIPPETEQLRIVAKVDELMDLCDQLEQQQESSITAHQTLVKTLLDALTTASERDGFTATWTRIAKHFDILFTTGWSIDQLKQTILQLAVMGKLVPQDPNDEPASELLKKIGAERVRLIKLGGVKKQKPLPSVKGEVKQFHIPESWEWCRFEELVDIQSGITKGRKLAGRETVTIPYLSVANVQRSYLDLGHVKEIEIPIEEQDKYKVLNRDLLITEGGDWDKVGRTAIWRNEMPYVAHQNHVFKARTFLQQMNEVWLEKYLNSSIAREYFAGSSKQTTNLASINKTQLRGCLIALPPLAEQDRIVIELERLSNIFELLKTRIFAGQSLQNQLANAVANQAIL